MAMAKADDIGKNVFKIFIAIFGIVVLLGGILTTLILSSLKGDAYQLSVTEIRRHAAVRQALGAPIQPGWLVSGTIQYHSDRRGDADLRYSIQGSTGRANVSVKATMLDNQWHLEEVLVIADASAANEPVAERDDVIAVIRSGGIPSQF
jgi:hypothetical protein